MDSTQSPRPLSDDGSIARGSVTPGWANRAGGGTLRVVVFLAGIGLLVGFFMPWLRFGQFAAVSGLSLMVSSGEAVDALAGPSRGMLILIPASGAALLGASVFGPRVAGMAALGTGIAILGLGLFTLARLFLETMGSGMLVVVGSALLAVGAGVAGLARSRSEG